MAETLPGTTLEVGRVLPGAAITDAATGHQVRAWDFRQRHALVIAFVHERCVECAAFVRSLDGVEEELRNADARVVVVEGDAPAFLDRGPPVVLVADRYAAGWRSYPAPDHRFPEPSEVAATLWHLARMCPECGAATW